MRECHSGTPDRAPALSDNTLVLLGLHETEAVAEVTWEWWWLPLGIAAAVNLFFVGTTLWSFVVEKGDARRAVAPYALVAAMFLVAVGTMLCGLE